MTHGYRACGYGMWVWGGVKAGAPDQHFRNGQIRYIGTRYVVVRAY